MWLDFDFTSTIPVITKYQKYGEIRSNHGTPKHNLALHNGDKKCAMKTKLFFVTKDSTSSSSHSVNILPINFYGMNLFKFSSLIIITIYKF